MEDLAEICKLAVDTCVWPLYEIEEGIWRLTYERRSCRESGSWKTSRSLRYSGQPHFADRSVELKDAYKKAAGRRAQAALPENMAEAVRQVNAWAATNTGNRIRIF